MKKWFRVALALTAAVVALTVGLTAASAAPASPGGPNPPDSSRASRAVVQPSPPLLPASARPPAKTETTYVAVTPCRIIDTRLAGGQFSSGQTRNYRIGGTLGFIAQGGRSGGCGIPVGATAIAASIGVTNTVHAGYVSAWPAGLPFPRTSNVNYAAGQTTASGGNISILSTSAVALQIYNYGGPTHVFVDVSGYYIPQIEGMIAPDGTVFSGSSRIVSAQYLGTTGTPGTYRVTFDTDVSFCTPQINTYSGYVYGSAYGFTGNTVMVYTWYLDSATHLETGRPYYFYISMSC